MDNSYWAGTENYDPNYASYFDFASGEQFDYTRDGTYYALAVYDSNIATTVVPEPVSSILFLAGGATLVFRRLRVRN